MPQIDRDWPVSARLVIDRRGLQVKLTETGPARHAEVLPLQRKVLTWMLDRSS
ncbi:hypothetical protein ACWFR1_13405 [Streptomyces sp. NPDC055103]